MGNDDHQGRAKRWVAGALGGAVLLGALGTQAVPPPPPLLRAALPGSPREAEPPGPEPEPEAPPGKEPGGARDALIWLAPMAGQLAGGPDHGD